MTTSEKRKIKALIQSFKCQSLIARKHKRATESRVYNICALRLETVFIELIVTGRIK